MMGDGYHDVPPGKLAMVVTHLEMTAKPPVRPGSAPEGITLCEVKPTLAWYRDIFTRVGALEWLWFSRLTLADEALAAILADRDVEIFALRRDGRNVGMLELDFRQPGTCELVFLGLTGDAVGTGIGRTLMNAAIGRAWARPIARFWVHTCTLDHPGALAFYRRSGFVPFAIHVEVAPDPRLDGTLPRDCAPHVPRLG